MIRRLSLLLLLLLACSPVVGTPRISEGTAWLRDYLRIDTTNPPGHESRAVDYLAGILARETISYQRLGKEPGRQNLWARLPATAGGEGARGAILLLHHLDVVPAESGWQVPPFSGEIRDGRLWGRGAIDDKSLGIAFLAAMIDLKRSGVPRTHDVIWLAVADEESGGGGGTAWLLEKHPELFAGVTSVIGEGGANRMAQDRLLWWGIEVAQKRPLWLEVTTEGRGGHGSGLNPWSANHDLIRGLDRLLGAAPRWRVSAPARTYLHALAPLHNPYWRERFLAIDRIVAPDGPREMLMPGLANLFLDTAQVTVLAGGDRINVIPPRARAQIDVRLLPDTDALAYLRQVKEALGPDLDVKVLLTSPPAAASPTTTPTFAAFQKTLGGSAPVVPAFIAGFTDSRYFRQRGIPAYGFSPFALEGPDLAGIHAVDERIPLLELDRGIERTKKLLRALAAP
ncbi:MAG TPA: M20/M25/M40 family metallo-hydrolase [Thermoanaerobaculia bacterium]|nr:M20/M25/M40 family metallo-hydrolase [Thermoanaerobaculia bacterium]